MRNTPLYTMLRKYGEGQPLPFHMPGHLLGRGLEDELKMAGRLDITEIPGSDCLHSPAGVIKEAQELAAKCFGAGYTLFLVNGSTAGIHTMVRSVVKPGGKLVIGRDSHRSVLNALALNQAEPVFVLPQVDEDNTIPLGVSAEALNQALESHPDAQGVLLTRPNYYGVAASLKPIHEITQSHGLPLLVDEAHGAHFTFHRSLPQTALEQGADLCVQSLHKTLPSLTQTALLHGRQDSKIDRAKVERAASMLQTTSPSYLLMASIDRVRELMENEGERLYEILLDRISNFESALLKYTVIERVARSYEGYETDGSRLVLSFKNTLLTGFEAEEQLRSRFGIVAEMADLNHVVLIATPYHTAEDFDKLLKALGELSKENKGKKVESCRPLSWPNTLPERILSLHEAFSCESCEVPIKEAVNHISADLVVPYPPGIPVLNPGEKITGEMIDYLWNLSAQGGSIHGLHDGRLHIIR